ncbi:uncharacterized protein LOC117103939 [Anneissia japonica]|uniref:uncharacterized protein LOC117103939 n=1 Tax=Anneissia japonica TaxID=1529436 RepID=UPI001425A161|nr:uncharacterized protein LOC117103939 [Anneissia japonica]XP_033100489.1 uncharacterized protein LOC117103939 [Anneissia japonica]
MVGKWLPNLSFVILCSATAFSLLSDGSQPKKTGSEKELVLVRTTRKGIAVYYTIALQDIDDFVNANADNLKRSIDLALNSKLKLPQERYINTMVSATSDGASVNTGVYSGLLTQMKRERSWLVTVHCVSHRMELALKDSLLKYKEFCDVKDFMVSIFNTMKRSGKLAREFKSIAKTIHVNIYTFPKVHGTRFLNHQRKGADVLLNNWVPFAQCIEHAISDKGYRAIKPKLKGYLVKLKNFSFFSSVCLYRDLLELVTPLSLTFERGNIMAFEVDYNVKKMINELHDMVADESEPYLNVSERSTYSFEIDNDDNVLKCTLPKPNHMRRKPENREYTQLYLTEMIRMSNNTHTAVQRLKEKVIPDIRQCLKSRLKSFDDEFYSKMYCIDPAN